MRILFLTSHLSDIDRLAHEAERAGSGLHLEPCASVRDALAALDGPGAIDAVVVDEMGVGDAADAIATLRVRTAVPVIALVRPGHEAASVTLLLAGADDAVPRRQAMTGGLQAACETVSSDSGFAARHTLRRLGWIGDAAAARRASTGRQGLEIQELSYEPVTGEPSLPDRAEAWPDAFVIDETVGAAQALGAVARLAQRAAGRPVVVVTEAGLAREVAYRRRGALAAGPLLALPELLRMADRAIEVANGSAELEALRARDQRLRTLIETLPQGVLRIGADGVLRAANLEALGVLGASHPADVVGRPLADLVAPGSHATLHSLLATVKTGERATASLTLSRGVVADLEGVPLAGDDRHGQVIATVRAAAEARETQSDPGLAERLAELSEQLDEARACAEAALDARQAAEAEAARLSDEFVRARGEWEASREVVESQLRDIEARQADEAVDAARRALRVREIEDAHASEVAALALSQAEALNRVAELEGLLASEREERRRINHVARDDEAAVRSQYEAAAAESAARVRHLLAELERNRTALASAHDEVDALRSRVTELEGGVAAWSAAHEAAEARARELAEVRAEQDEAVTRALAEAERLRHDVAVFKAREEMLDVAVREASARVSAIDAQLDTERAQVSALEAALADERARAMALDHTAQAERARGAALEAEVAELRRTRNEVVDELARLRQVSDDAFERCAEAERRLAVEEEKARSAVAEAEAATFARLAVVEELATVRALVEAATAEAVATREAHAREHTRADDLARQFADMEASRAELSLELERLREVLATRDRAAAHEGEQYRQLLARHDDLIASHDELRRSFAEAQAEVERIRRELVSSEGDRETLRRALDQAEATRAVVASREADARALVEQALAAAHVEAAEHAARIEAQLDASDRGRRALDAREARFRERAPVGIATATGDGVLLDCNDVFAEWCGATSGAELMAGQPFVLPFSLAVSSPPATGESGSVVDACIERGDGRVVWIEGTSVLLDEEADPPTWRWVFVDVTDRQVRLQQARQVGRLHAVASLASAAGHDLDALMGRVREAIDTLASPGEADTVASAARMAVARARTIVQQLAAYAHRQARPPRVVDIARLATDLAPTLRRLAGTDVGLEVDAARPVLVSADPDDLEKVLTGVVIASRDALPAGGTIALTLSPRLLDPRDGRSRQHLAVLTCTASGFGARQAAPATSVAETVAQHGGYLRARHDPGREATFELVWPLVQGVDHGVRAHVS